MASSAAARSSSAGVESPPSLAQLVGQPIAAGPEPPDAVLLRRLRAACWTTLAIIPLYTLANSGLALSGVAPAIALAQLAIVACILALLYRGEPRHPRRLALIGVAGLCITAAAAGVVARDVLMPPLLLCGLALSTAAVLPWGLPSQLLTVSMAGIAVAVDLLWLRGVAPALPPAVLFGAATALGVSVLIARDSERSRGEIARRDRVLRERLRRQEAWIQALPVTLHRTMLSGEEAGRMWLSDNVCQVTGFPAAHFTHPDGVTRWAQRVHPDDRQVFAAAARDMLQQKTATNEYRWQHADGSYRWLLSESVLLFDDNGHPLEAIGSVLDLTERKHAEEELKESEQRHRLVTQVTNDAIWDWDLRSDAVTWNDAVQVLFGYAADEVGLDCTWWVDHIHPDDRERVRASLEAVVESGRDWRASYRFQCRDGSYALIEDRAQVVRDAQGRGVRMIGAMTDITMRTQAENRLRQSEAMFRSLVEKGSDLFGIIDAEGRMRYVSPSHRRVLGYAPEQLLGRMVAEYVHPDDLVEMTERFDIMRDTAVEFRFRHADGSWRTLESRIDDLTGDPDIGGIVANSRDVTDRKRTELEIQRAKDAAEAASRVKSEFVANMSHEIRTPMNAILGMTDLALDTDLTPEQRDYLETVHTAGNWLLTLINDLLDFSKLEAGKVALDLVEFHFEGMLQETLRMLSARAQEKGLKLTCIIDPAVPEIVIGDPGRLRQVLVNLIGNGIKFADHGGVSVEVSCGHIGDGGEVDLVVSVRDTGIGIDPAQHATIFDPFEQADSSASRRYGGTGLGLAIAKQLVGLMGGTIGVESEIGRGSTFRFNALLWRARPSARLHAPAVVPIGRSPEPDRSLYVLLVEDNAVNQHLATRLLEKHGHRVRVAVNGREALAALAGESFDVVLMDVQMPEMDGLEATAAVRALEAEGRLAQPHVPIVAMTAHALSGDRERCLAAGMDDYVSKPIRADQLFAAIQRVMDGQPPAVAAAS